MTDDNFGSISFEQFFANSSDLMSVADARGNFIQVNAAFRNILGWNTQELIGQSYTTLIHPDDIVQVAAAFEPVDGVIPSDVEMELRELCRDGSYRWMKWTIKRYGDLHYAVGHDITLRKETMNALASSIEKSRAIFDAAVDSIIVINEKLIVVEASPSNEGFFSFSKESTEGMYALDFVHPDDHADVIAAINNGFENNEVITVRYRGLHTNGQWVAIESRGRAIRDARGSPTGAVIISRDITKVVQAQLVLEAAKVEAEHANVAKSEFMSRMSHELRTPLNSVLGFAQILQMEMTSPEELELIGYIMKSGGYLLELINEVLDISRVESGSIAVSLDLVSVNDLVSQCIAFVTPQAGESGIEIVNECSEEFRVRADPLRLEQVLVNLLTNAIKFNHRGGTVTLTSVDLDGRMRLSVTDTGPGVAPQLHDRLFAPFDRLDAESKGIDGTGLGLALSKGLVEAFGGSLGVESTVGEGSTFWMELLVATTSTLFNESDTLDLDLDLSADDPLSSERQATLLYIEDNVGNVRLIERLLNHRPNIRLITTLLGSNGFALAEQHRPDLILLDVHLPDLPGIDVLGQLQRDERTSDIPVVMLSADASQEQIRRFDEAGARDYLTKPLDLQNFLTLLDEYLDETARTSETVRK
ncbi:MAG: PAS domain S-box protein [Acidimicrobiales bacterium]